MSACFEEEMDEEYCDSNGYSDSYMEDIEE
jgi:hypothetical protein